MKNFRFVDLFCDGGGSITGAVQALTEAGQSYDGNNGKERKGQEDECKN